MPLLTPRQIAAVCHEANRELQFLLGEEMNEPWGECGEELMTSATNGVIIAMEGATPEELHASWCEERISNGWIYGEEKDFESKTHPCLVRYSELPEEQRLKDHLFGAIVGALSRSDV